MSEPILDAAESKMDFPKQGQSPVYGFFRTRLESQISILDARVVSLVLNANNHYYKLVQN